MEGYMKVYSFLLSFIFLSFFIFPGCGDKDNKADEEMVEEETTGNQTDQNQTDNQTTDDQNQVIEKRDPVKPVSFKKLMVYLPTSVADLSAEKPQGESMTMGEWSYSDARNTFNSEDGSKRAEVHIYDYAYISEMYMPYQTLFNMKYERESSDGYEKSTMVSGNPAFEKWNENGMDSEITVLVGKRFIVTARTNGMPEGSAKNIVEGMNLGDLQDEKSD
jgi:hypothetical protein